MQLRSCYIRLGRRLWGILVGFFPKTEPEDSRFGHSAGIAMGFSDVNVCVFRSDLPRERLCVFCVSGAKRPEGNQVQ